MLWWTLRELQSNNEPKRIKAATKLAASKDRRAIDHLISSLADSSFSVRAEVVRALGQMGDKRAVEPILKLAQDDSGTVRQGVVEAITKLGDDQAKMSLASLLKDDDAAVRQSAAQALQQIEAPEVTKALSEYRRKEEESKRLADEARAKHLAEMREAEEKRALEDKQRAETRREAEKASRAKRERAYDNSRRTVPTSSPSGASCSICKNGIPANEMRNLAGELGLSGVGGGDDFFAKVMGAMNMATTAWKCSRCGDWVCNSCVLRLLSGSGATAMAHARCGGMFRAP